MRRENGFASPLAQGVSRPNPIPLWLHRVSSQEECRSIGAMGPSTSRNLWAEPRCKCKCKSAMVCWKRLTFLTTQIASGHGTAGRQGFVNYTILLDFASLPDRALEGARARACWRAHAAMCTRTNVVPRTDRPVQPPLCVHTVWGHPCAHKRRRARDDSVADVVVRAICDVTALYPILGVRHRCGNHDAGRMRWLSSLCVEVCAVEFAQTYW